MGKRVGNGLDWIGFGTGRRIGVREKLTVARLCFGCARAFAVGPRDEGWAADIEEAFVILSTT